jgi:hypothetical protein
VSEHNDDSYNNLKERSEYFRPIFEYLFMKVAISDNIIKTIPDQLFVIFCFFNANNVELVIEENFLAILKEEIVKKEYKTF